MPNYSKYLMERKNMTGKWAMAIFIVIAALILPQALAIDVGFSVPAGSTNLQFSSTPGVSVGVNNVGNTNVLSGSGSIESLAGGNVSQYYEWISTNGLAKAASFAYMKDSDYYKYQFTGSRGSTYATANLKFSATNADQFLLGGFAYNARDYAGALLSGDWADSIKYSNSLYASGSKVSATQSFSGTDFEDLEAYTWAERGNLDDEFTEADDIDPAVTNDWSPQAGIIFADDRASDSLLSEQYMYLDDGSILNTFKPYKATASLCKNAATSSQSVALNGADDDDASVQLGSYAILGDSYYFYGDNGFAAYTMLYADGVTEKLNNVVYSSSSKATTALATASQSASVYQADAIMKGAQSIDNDDHLISYEYTDVDRYSYSSIWNSTSRSWENEDIDSGISSSLIGSDSATAKKGFSSVTQQVTKASGAYIDKFIGTGNDVLDDYVTDSTQVFGELNVGYTNATGVERTDTLARVPQKASTLSGKSTATTTLTGAAISGNWKACIAKDLTEYDDILTAYNAAYDNIDVGEDFGYSFMRTSHADNGDASVNTALKSTQRAASSFTFREADRATEFGTWV